MRKPRGKIKPAAFRDAPETVIAPVRKPRGRPRKPTGMKKTRTIYVRVSPPVDAALRDAARRNGKTIAGYISDTIRVSFFVTVPEAAMPPGSAW